MPGGIFHKDLLEGGRFHTGAAEPGQEVGEKVGESHRPAVVFESDAGGVHPHEQGGGAARLQHGQHQRRLVVVVVKLIAGHGVILQRVAPAAKGDMG